MEIVRYDRTKLLETLLRFEKHDQAPPNSPAITGMTSEGGGVAVVVVVGRRPYPVLWEWLQARERRSIYGRYLQGQGFRNSYSTIFAQSYPTTSQHIGMKAV